jgi:hypothetical protein
MVRLVEVKWTDPRPKYPPKSVGARNPFRPFLLPQKKNVLVLFVIPLSLFLRPNIGLGTFKHFQNNF